MTDISQNQLELKKIMQEDLYNLNPTERKEFIMKYTVIQFNGEFNHHADIIDLQNEYTVGEAITFTVATWGYGHPCQSPSFVYYYETKNPENIVFEDKFIRFCQPLRESDFMYYYQELDSSGTNHASQSDIFPVFDKSGSYIISVDDIAEYEFQIIEEITDISQDPLGWDERKVVSITPLGYPKCYPDKIDPIHGIIMANQTHQFNVDTCEWESVVYPPPGHLEPENSTHVGLGYEN